MRFLCDACFEKNQVRCTSFCYQLSLLSKEKPHSWTCPYYLMTVLLFYREQGTEHRSSDSATPEENVNDFYEATCSN